MPSADLQPHELMQILADFFEAQKIPYRVVGSMASMAYGEPRFTNDVDIVAELKAEQIAALCAQFAAQDYYLSEAAARAAVAQHTQFNIIHPASGLKADIIIPPPSDFMVSAAKRIRRLSSEGEYSAWFASPEDVLLNKLLDYRLSGGASDKHLRDIAGMIKLQREKLDRAYISTWAAKQGLTSEWETVWKLAGGDLASAP